MLKRCKEGCIPVSKGTGAACNVAFLYRFFTSVTKFFNQRVLKWEVPGLYYRLHSSVQTRKEITL
jgi:hypothetical protein